MYQGYSSELHNCFHSLRESQAINKIEMVTSTIGKCKSGERQGMLMRG